jgi:hypothetical protein
MSKRKPYPKTIHFPLSLEESSYGDKRKVRCEILAHIPDDDNADCASLFVQRVDGCSYEVTSFTLEEAEQLSQALLKMVAEIKAYTKE